MLRKLWRTATRGAMDRKLIIGTLILLLIQVFLLVADVDIYFFANNNENDSFLTEKIGSLINKKKNVKRRSQGSIVWEDSQESDSLMTNDSILTLENSSAQLKLKDEVKISLHENTLIVLETLENKKNDSLRIRFNYGDFFSQNRKQRLQVGSGDILLDAKPGTNLSLKSIEGDQIEVEVVSGSVDVVKKHSPHKSQTIENGTRFTISKTEIEDVQKISGKLKFSIRPEERLYTHEFNASFLLHWQGEAEQIRVVGPNKKPFYINIKNKKEHTLQLTQGTHYLSLVGMGADQISSEVALRVLQAPRIRYTSPLPRDRFELGTQVLFSWLKTEGVFKYELELTNYRGERERFLTEGNIYKTAPQIEGDVQMRVWGEDEEGFRIPPYYALQLYLVRDPFLPPKLLAPKVAPKPFEKSVPREPTSKPETQSPPENKTKDHHSVRKKSTNWIYALFFGELATAQELQPSKEKSAKIIFSWQPVVGADFYNIEISSEKDFLKPEILQVVKENSFTWTNYSKQTYYWRVAAGAHSGRMGLFCEAATLDLLNIDNLKPGEIAPGVQFEIEVAAPTPTAVATVAAPQQVPPSLMVAPPPPPSPPPAAAALPAAPAEENTQWQHSLAINLYHLNYSLNGDFSATLAGFANHAFSEKSHYTFYDRSELTLSARYTSVTWKPEKESTIPFQDEFSTSEYSGTALYNQLGHDISYGLHLTTLTTLKRVALENVKNHTSFLFGPALGYRTILTKELNYLNQSAIIYGDQIGGVNSENQLNYNFNHYTLGGDLNFTIFFGAQSLSGFYLKSGLHFAITW